MDRNTAFIRLGFTELERALGLPEGVRVAEVARSTASDELLVRLEGQGLPRVAEGFCIPTVMTEVKGGATTLKL